MPGSPRTWGWQWAFIVTGALGFLWLAFWLWCYDDARRAPAAVAAEELAYIRSDPPEPSDAGPVGAAAAAIGRPGRSPIGKFLTDPVWWLYLFWIPDFLNRNYGLDLTSDRAAARRHLPGRDVGSIGGGWLLVVADQAGLDRERRAQDGDADAARLPSCRSSSRRRSPNLWLAVRWSALAAAAHQGWSANLFTLASDMFPRHAVGSVVGIGGMAGAVGGMLHRAASSARSCSATGSYVPIFLIAGVRLSRRAAIIHLLVPTMKPVRFE